MVRVAVPTMFSNVVIRNVVDAPVIENVTVTRRDDYKGTNFKKKRRAKGIVTKVKISRGKDGSIRKTTRKYFVD